MIANFYGLKFNTQKYIKNLYIFKSLYYIKGKKSVSPNMLILSHTFFT